MMDPVSFRRGGIAPVLAGAFAGALIGALAGPGLPAQAASPSPASPSSGPDTPSSEGWLSVEITGLRNDKGTVRVALCHTQYCYEEREGFLKEAVIPAAIPNVKIRFDDLPAGQYTVLMYHDEDADGKFDRHFLGWPEEGFGFSRNASPNLSAPDYDDVVLRVGPQGLHTQLTVQYW